jgi:glycosyltransferase involved in cell wall biosynthesis
MVASTLSYLTGQQADPEDDSDVADGINVLRAYTLPVAHRSFVWRVIGFFSFMMMSVWTSRQAKNVDLVMGTTPPIFQAVSAWFIAWIRRKPFLLEVRDLWPEFAIDMGVLKNPILIQLSRWLETFLYRQADHILVNSPAYRDYMLKRGIATAKVSLIANGADLDAFAPGIDGQPMRHKLGLDDQFIVTYTGALGMANDIFTILRAAEKLKEHNHIHFLLVGDGKERARLEAAAEASGLRNVLFTGGLPKTDMPKIVAASDVCVATLLDIPMFRTTYPNKVFDYMSAGKPTILGIDGVIREVVEAANGGIFVPPGDAEALATAILRLKNDPAGCRQMGESARAYVAAHFDRSDQAREFARLLESMSA